MCSSHSCGRLRGRKRGCPRLIKILGVRKSTVIKKMLDCDFIINDVENTDVLERNSTSEVIIPKPKLRKVKVSNQKPLLKIDTTSNSKTRLSVKSSSSDSSSSSSSDASSNFTSQQKVHKCITTIQISDIKGKDTNSELNPSVCIATEFNEKESCRSNNQNLNSLESVISDKKPANAKNPEQINNKGLLQLSGLFQEANKHFSEEVFQGNSKQINKDLSEVTFICEKSIYPNLVVGLEDSALCVEVSNPVVDKLNVRKCVAKKTFQKSKRKLFVDADEKPEIAAKLKTYNIEDTINSRRNFSKLKYSVNNDSVSLRENLGKTVHKILPLDLHNTEEDSNYVSTQVCTEPDSPKSEGSLSDGESSTSTLPVSPNVEHTQESKKNICSVARKTFPPKLGSKKSVESSESLAFFPEERDPQFHTISDKIHSQHANKDISLTNVTESVSVGEMEVSEECKTSALKFHVGSGCSNMVFQTNSLNVDYVHQIAREDTLKSARNEFYNDKIEQTFENTEDLSLPVAEIVSSNESDNEQYFVNIKNPCLVLKETSLKNNHVLERNDFYQKTDIYKQQALTSFKEKNSTHLMSNNYEAVDNSNNGFSFYGCTPKHVDLNSLSLKVQIDNELLQIPVVDVAQILNFFPRVLVKDVMVQLLKFYSFP